MGVVAYLGAHQPAAGRWQACVGVQGGAVYCGFYHPVDSPTK